MKKILSKSYWVDRDIEKMIGELLRYGVIISSAIVFIGGVGYLAYYGKADLPQYHLFGGESSKYTTLGGIFRSVLSLNGKGIIQLGVVALIATPILRIAFSLLAFFVEKDRLYIVITFIVLSVMLLSLVGGLKA